MLYVVGERILVLMSPSDASQVFKDESSFAFDSFINMVHRGVGNVSDEAKILWCTPKEGFTSLHLNPHGKVLVHTGNALLHKELLTPSCLQEFTGKVIGYIEDNMMWESFFDTGVLSSNANTKIVSLHCWCRDVLIEAQNRAWSGQYIRELEPRMTVIF